MRALSRLAIHTIHCQNTSAEDGLLFRHSTDGATVLLKICHQMLHILLLAPPTRSSKLSLYKSCYNNNYYYCYLMHN